MKHVKSPFLILALVTALTCNGQSSTNQNKLHEKIIKDYFEGWVKKDWSMVSAQLGEGFTFTSAAPDDHISIEKFKEKCWTQAAHIKRFDFVKIIGNENEAFAIVHVITGENNVIRNTEYFNFSNGKIKSIEVFFGGNGQGFPTNKKNSNAAESALFTAFN
jgi:hypothetical protein